MINIYIDQYSFIQELVLLKITLLANYRSSDIDEEFAKQQKGISMWSSVSIDICIYG